jgi:hypothetical protein
MNPLMIGNAVALWVAAFSFCEHPFRQHPVLHFGTDIIPPSGGEGKIGI